MPLRCEERRRVVRRDERRILPTGSDTLHGAVRAVIQKQFSFEASHSLPNHAGKCRELHGHSYRVELAFEGEIKPARGESDDGMVTDFLDVSEWWKREVQPLVDP